VEFAKFHRGRKSALSSQQYHDNVDGFFYIQGIVHKEFVLPGQTVSGRFYCEVLKRLNEGIRSKTSRQVEEQQLVSPP
jgi:hypothetical protein